jgi:hypothetical protein
MDILSGSWPGEIYLFRRRADGSFAAGEVLKDRHGKPVHAGSASAAFAADWDGDGTLDLVVGNVLGEVHFIPNEGTGRAPEFGTPRRLEAAGKPIRIDSGDAAPVVADWDGDGRPDLVVGCGDGGVVWFRNAGSRGEPRLEAARTLVPPSPLGWGGDDKRQPGDWGLRAKPCVVDWDGDGRPDLLVGDVCGGFQAKPTQKPEEAAEERRANDRLPGLRRRWAAAFRRYREAQDAPPHETPAARRQRLHELDALREEVRRTKDEIAAVQEVQGRYKPGYQSHGFVWLFVRK